MLTKFIKQRAHPLLSYSMTIHHNRANPNLVEDTRNVELRGTYIHGYTDDLPNLIFIPEVCDRTGNWLNFFTKDDHRLLAYRNVHIVYPRNFGNSDRHSSFDMEEMANDVARYMYKHKISTATLAGHGLGAKLALAVGCYHSERVTGYIGFDTTPMDQRYHEAFQELQEYIAILRTIPLNRSRGDLEQILKKAIPDRKWRSIFSDNLIKEGNNLYKWGFNLEAFAQNLKFNKADSLGYWAEKNGLFGGRAMFAFPEYSRWVHLNTNTMPMRFVCPRVRGYGEDIFAVQGDENPENHWIYDDESQAKTFATKMRQFLNHYDGVHVLLHNRSEIGGGAFIPDRFGSRNDPNYLYGDYAPAHLHHNWRFSDIYEESKRIRQEKEAQAAQAAQEDGAKNH